MRAFFPFFIAACSADPGPPGQVDADEARELNEAAAMLDDDSVDPDAVEEDGGAEREAE